ncbi:MAG: flagellar biosynthesis protein FlgD [Pirellulaceae bacterium]|jgi:flagellar basal-body rod modification protein FlgD|nr:flagellar biosynthesis protein FlgD [Pirellulaceae bacterium]
MTSIPGVGGSSSSLATKSNGNGMADLDTDQFLGLLLTEMQNQDPLQPMDNSQMLTQMSQIREIGSNDRLTSTLSNLAAGQELSMASSMIGKTVKALDSNAKDVEGKVDRVSVQTDAKDSSKRTVSVHIGDSVVDISNIREIVET